MKKKVSFSRKKLKHKHSDLHERHCHLPFIVYGAYDLKKIEKKYLFYSHSFFFFLCVCMPLFDLYDFVYLLIWEFDLVL